MTRILAEDGPWTWGFHPVALHPFARMGKRPKPNAMANNTMKYSRVDPEETKETLREAWNAPKVCR